MYAICMKCVFKILVGTIDTYNQNGNGNRKNINNNQNC